MARILIVDDEASYRTTLEAALDDHDVTLAASGEEAIALEREEPFDLVVTDLQLGGADGVDVLKAYKRRDPHCEVMLMTAYATVETAVEAMKLGCFDYVTKPFSLDEFHHRISNALERRENRTTIQRLRRDLENRYGLHRVVGTSAVMQEICKKLLKVATSDATVLLAGESGTGKGLLARAIHQNSPRRERPFVEINCAGLPEALLESELFGHARGAFTDAKTARKGLIEEADQGSFFLDEIGDASVAIQAKLLKVLEEGELRRIGENAPRPVDVRFIAASNKDLRALVDEGQFREDLFFRLHVVALLLPALRERAEDIPLLAAHFLQELAGRAGKPVCEIEPAALDVLRGYSWPGNIRELRNVLEHAVIMADDDLIRESDLPAFLRAHAAPPSGNTDFGDLSLAELEERHIRALVERKKDLGSIAKILGIGRTTLWRKMKEYGLQK